MKPTDAIRLFGLNNLSIESGIQRLELDHDIDLGHRPKPEAGPEQQFYPQFSQRLREEADAMAQHYAIFYCLENSIRQLISDRLGEAHGENWWDIAVPPNVRDNATKNRAKEVAAGVTLRSEEMIDYSNFGELGEILKGNWTIFGDMLRDISAVQKILGSLNSLRAPIAHCKPLAADEVLRLHLGLRDWFRQMG
ncbi:MAG TPA: Swt1 family HEPN domain-containing protein [Bradyrhizobium sp.]|nr:Swt1 family HEPN domain-containing protein [Bradyrhizobium sp.]